MVYLLISKEFHDVLTANGIKKPSYFTSGIFVQNVMNSMDQKKNLLPLKHIKKEVAHTGTP